VIPTSRGDGLFNGKMICMRARQTKSEVGALSASKPGRSKSGGLMAPVGTKADMDVNDFGELNVNATMPTPIHGRIGAVPIGELSRYPAFTQPSVT
jgi:hypothetical protein